MQQLQQEITSHFYAAGHDRHLAQRDDRRRRSRRGRAADVRAPRVVARPVRRHPAAQGRPLLPAKNRQAHRRQVQDQHQGQGSGTTSPAAARMLTHKELWA